MKKATLQLRQRGNLTLPADLRSKYGIQPGDALHLIDLGGIFVLAPATPLVGELSREIEQARLDAGLTMDELLKGLQQQREQYYQEKYART
jgi:bifunctional DNA-binding transcriptional regulator/antitoxin component of YhaV-PrlF toxin-antitoxin module